MLRRWAVTVLRGLGSMDAPPSLESTENSTETPPAAPRTPSKSVDPPFAEARIIHDIECVSPKLNFQVRQREYLGLLKLSTHGRPRRTNDQRSLWKRISRTQRGSSRACAPNTERSRRRDLSTLNPNEG